jgi:hypothetical protein
MQRPPGSHRGLDRYAPRLRNAGDWYVWDIRRKQPVFGADTLSEYEARKLARRLNEAYQRARRAHKLSTRVQ